MFGPKTFSIAACALVIMKCKYRVRWFSSKGAFLVLLWTLLISITLFSLSTHFVKIVHSNPIKWLSYCLVLTVVVAAPLSGWLADAKFGNYKVFRVGAVLLFIATVMNCLFLILEKMVLEGNNINVLHFVYVLLKLFFLIVGGCACVVTALPLGLDQMPDASSSSIASYIAWFVCSLYIGGFIGEIFLLFLNCIDEEMHSSYTLIWALLLVVCMSIVLASNFLFSPKWLIIEPKSPQSLKTIYFVLKFAAKHKAPLNRSALTYWEEDIPSRIDLGKSKYGGPFTTEQVEDVKTVLRLLAISLPFAVIGISLVITGYLPLTFNASLNACVNNFIHLFLYTNSWYSLLGNVVHEFLIYPFISKRLPSILKRIGTVCLLVILGTFICFILKLAFYLADSSKYEWIAQALHSFTLGTLSQCVVTLTLEFMCAQSPYNMRGLILSLTMLLLLLTLGVQLAFRTYFIGKICTQPWCPLILYSVQLALHIFGFLLFCVVAHWYKLRVRDDDYSPQRVVEEVYDRYLTAAAAQSRFYRVASN